MFATQEYRDALKKKKGEEKTINTSNFTTLSQWLYSATSEAVVGLEKVGSSLYNFTMVMNWGTGLLTTKVDIQLH